MVIRKRRDSVFSKRCWLFIGMPRLCFAANRIAPLPNYHRFKPYLAQSIILPVALSYRRHFIVFSLQHDLSLERKIVLLHHDLFREKKNYLVAVRFVFEKKFSSLFVVLNSAKFYFSTYFVDGTPYKPIG